MKQRLIIDTNQPLVDENGYPSETLQQANISITRAIKILGTGSPEGVVSAMQYSEYIDITGSAGSSHYWKKDTDVAGDTSKGWQLV